LTPILFTYHFAGHTKFSPSCSWFLENIERGNYKAFVNDLVFSEVLLNFIKSELFRKKKIHPKEAVKEIKKDFRLLRGLRLADVSELFNGLNLRVISSDFNILELAEGVEKGLLPNDALHLLATRKAGIENIATNDKDFERVKGIKVWKP
jgi:predicted nucleic acid-binding protein